MHLYTEIRAQGYAGSHPTLRAFLTDLRRMQHLVDDPRLLQLDASQTTIILPTELPPKRAVSRRISPARATWLLFLPADRLTDSQREQREQIRTGHADVETAAALVNAFVQILMERHVEALASWFATVEQSQVVELHRFATGLRRDRSAVEAACSNPLSNGQVEGQITRLKLLKRQMYGRANFDLLRLRVLYRA
jgi:transposase